MSQVIAIFGAGRGLGTALARRFAREGYRVALVARRAERLDALVRDLAAEGVEAAAFPADLSDPANGRAVVEAIRARWGRVDFVSYQPCRAARRSSPPPGSTARPWPRSSACSC
ncbi:SDR family NAD(P)-dependent oxidoreductase [Lentzea sp. NPDC058436]|uniref:SDR family NAD(P)-dependent oxidoreductase n=1 Tax=Lentzea sp. NPDC058436 TaxID=3346499 RepID=UPI00364D8A63